MIMELRKTPETVVGLNKIENMNAYVSSTKVFIITDEVLLENTPTIQRIYDSLTNKNVKIFTKVEPNPTILNVEEGVKELNSFGDATIICVGGGSVIDCGKAVAFMADKGGNLSDYCIRLILDSNDKLIAPEAKVGFKMPYTRSRQFIAVPTTAGTGSETNGYAVISNAHRKLILSNKALVPDLCVLDASVTITAPSRVKSMCGFDAFTHATEALFSSKANTCTDMYALESIKKVYNNLGNFLENQVDASQEMLIGAHLAGISFYSSGLGLAHALGLPLTSKYGIPHGKTLAMTLPCILHKYKESRKDIFDKVEQVVGRSLEQIMLEIISYIDFSTTHVCNPTAQDIHELTEEALRDTAMFTVHGRYNRKIIYDLYCEILKSEHTYEYKDNEWKDSGDTLAKLEDNSQHIIKLIKERNNVSEEEATLELCHCMHKQLEYNRDNASSPHAYIIDYTNKS